MYFCSWWYVLLWSRVELVVGYHGHLFRRFLLSSTNSRLETWLFRSTSLNKSYSMTIWVKCATRPKETFNGAPPAKVCAVYLVIRYLWYEVFMLFSHGWDACTWCTLIRRLVMIGRLAFVHFSLVPLRWHTMRSQSMIITLAVDYIVDCM